MPPPAFRPGEIINTAICVPARLCLRRGYKRTSLPAGEYLITEVCRNEEYWYIPEYSDGYTYRVMARSLHGKRISVWQNDLITAVRNRRKEKI